MKTIVLVFAMKEEMQAMVDVLSTPLISKDGYFQSQINSHTVIQLITTGVTMLQCYRLLPLLAPKPSEVIQVGTCAGLKQQPIGDVIHAKTFYNADLDLTAFGRSPGRLFVEKKLKVTPHVLVSGSSFLASTEKANHVKNTFQADGFDMESFGFYTMCASHDIPFSSIRGISDNGQTHANQSFEKNLAIASKQAALTTLKYLQTSN
jgi:adenosylhomocysteine nucleosidase